MGRTFCARTAGKSWRGKNLARRRWISLCKRSIRSALIRWCMPMWMAWSVYLGSLGGKMTACGAIFPCGKGTGACAPLPAGRNCSAVTSFILPALANGQRWSRCMPFLRRMSVSVVRSSRNCTGRSSGAKSCPRGRPRQTPFKSFAACWAVKGSFPLVTPSTISLCLKFRMKRTRWKTPRKN